MSRWQTTGSNRITERTLSTISDCWQHLDFQNLRQLSHQQQVLNGAVDRMLACASLWAWLDEVLVDEVARVLKSSKC